MSSVKAWTEPVELPTYEPAEPDRNPMFLEKRVYQGSSGRVYPLPYYDRIAERPTPRRWTAIHLENEYLYVMILPELGGRIHIGRDKTNGYDFFYNQRVIKPALVGLAGPWCSGGVEFNWPQHHRPATFMPVDTEIESHPDGSVTVWCSDHDPMLRMKGMHGVCLHPGRAVIELKVRAYNRTDQPQSFLWWANVATKVHDQYQSFFPPDVTYVADHARRSMSEYPLCRGRYYGVDYGKRVSGVRFRVSGRGSDTRRPTPDTLPPNDLSWYANIPVPTSYMCMGSQEDFFGGYDHAARAGVVHVANHHISPGKKQWTWGNHPFGYAWDRNLTNPDAQGECAPYIEIMAGVYTDNQPDFSFLMPGETKAWSQFWYPIREIGPAQQATADAALALRVVNGVAHLGLAVTQARIVRVELCAGGRVFHRQTVKLNPAAPLVTQVRVPPKFQRLELSAAALSNGRALIKYVARAVPRGAVPPPATEPPPPAELASADELYLAGLHLEQYRHATRCPTLYWREALRRDPGDARCNNAMGRWHLRRGELEQAESCFRAAIERLTRRNANPYDGEAWYNLGLCLRHRSSQNLKPDTRSLITEAYAAFYKSAWNFAWQAPAFHALAELDCRRKDWATALDHLERALRLNTDNLRARSLRVMVLRQLGRKDDLPAVRRLDPLDPWSRWLRNPRVRLDTQTRLDLAHDLARAGFVDEAVGVLAAPAGSDVRDLGAEPMRLYTLGWIQEARGDAAASARARRAAAAAKADYCFPARLEDIAVLESAMRADPRDARAPYYLGNLLYDRRRHAQAIRMWQRAASRDRSYPTVWRNLGIGYFNIQGRADRARAAYDAAIRAAPDDARLWFERDQLLKRIGEAPARRLRRLERRLDLVARRDDLTVELCALYNQLGRPADALRLLDSRRFQPWEGGEGQALGQYKQARLALGRSARAACDVAGAVTHFRAALDAPENLGEAWHLLQNQSDTHFWLGEALAAAGDRRAARRHWTLAAEFKGDFQEMSVRALSELTYYSARAMERLGRRAAAQRLLRDLLAYAEALEKQPAKIDYFATSLPTMLLFEDDLQARQITTARFLQAQALQGQAQCMGRTASRLLLRRARTRLREVLRRDPSHALAAAFLAGAE
jgi:tetratricopeptide (TPR) repeat protein